MIAQILQMMIRVFFFIKIIPFLLFINIGRDRYIPPYNYLLAENYKEIPRPNILNGLRTTIIKTNIENANEYPNIKDDKGSNGNQFDQADQGQNIRFTSFHLYVSFQLFLIPEVDILNLLFGGLFQV